jgi:hypothetical protein
MKFFIATVGYFILLLSFIIVWFGVSRFSYHEGTEAQSIDRWSDFLLHYATLPTAIIGIGLIILSSFVNKKQ